MTLILFANILVVINYGAPDVSIELPEKVHFVVGDAAGNPTRRTIVPPPQGVALLEQER